MGFREIPQPYVCAVLGLEDSTPDAILTTLVKAEYEGADAFTLELQGVEETYRNPEALKPVFQNTTKPIFTANRRYQLRGSEFVYSESEEESRTRTQLDLIEVGSMGFDMEFDTFDPYPGPSMLTEDGKRYSYDRESLPREVTTNPNAVERQMEVIEEAHRGGGDVMLSTHALTRLTPEGALWIGRLAEERGADAVKIVQFCANYEDVVECLSSTVLLKRKLGIPYVMMAMAEYGKLTRPIAPLLGSMLVFARLDYKPGSFLDQPPVRAMRAVLDNIDHRISRRTESFLPTEMLSEPAEPVLSR